MSRVKRGIIANKRRKNLLKQTKGFKWGRKSKERAAKEALLHAWSHAFVGRKEKKRDFRRLWQVKIKAATELFNLKYNQFVFGLKKNQINLNRKVLAELAENQPEIFQAVVEEAKK